MTTLLERYLRGAREQARSFVHVFLRSPLTGWVAGRFYQVAAEPAEVVPATLEEALHDTHKVVHCRPSIHTRVCTVLAEVIQNRAFGREPRAEQLLDRFVQRVLPRYGYYGMQAQLAELSKVPGAGEAWSMVAQVLMDEVSWLCGGALYRRLARPRIRSPMCCRPVRRRCAIVSSPPRPRYATTTGCVEMSRIGELTGETVDHFARVHVQPHVYLHCGHQRDHSGGSADRHYPQDGGQEFSHRKRHALCCRGRHWYVHHLRGWISM